MDVNLASALTSLLEDRHSARILGPGAFSPSLIDDLHAAARTVPSSYGTQPWRVIVLHERHGQFWDVVCQTIRRRLEGDRRDRYLARAEGMRYGGMTILVFEDLKASEPRNGQSPEDARDHTAQALGMLQFALWLILTAHGLATSPQHWQEFLEDIAVCFVGLPLEGFKMVAFMPVGRHVECPGQRDELLSRVSLEAAN